MAPSPTPETRTRPTVKNEKIKCKVQNRSELFKMELEGLHGPFVAFNFYEFPSLGLVVHVYKRREFQHGDTMHRRPEVHRQCPFCFPRFVATLYSVCQCFEWCRRVPRYSPKKLRPVFWNVVENMSVASLLLSCLFSILHPGT